MLLVRRRGEADEVFHDDVDRAAHGVSPQVGEIERFRPDALAGESGVAMHHDGDDLVRSFPRTVKVGAAQPVTRLLGARAADCNGIDSFQMARIRHEVHPDFFAGAGNVRSEEHTSELQSRLHLVCRLLLEKKTNTYSCTATRRMPNPNR